MQIIRAFEPILSSEFTQVRGKAPQAGRAR